MIAPDINSSTRAEREAFLKEEFKCISNCEMCGNCQFLHNRDAEEVYKEYLEGKKSFREVTIEHRNTSHLAR